MLVCMYFIVCLCILLVTFYPFIVISVHLERVKGIGPSYSAWKADALPLSYTRNFHTKQLWRWNVTNNTTNLLINIFQNERYRG
ncbi:MAG: hypothetical protein UW18_C0006G0039 [Microgenomates group bacterium GW2011_GWF1_44_10]|nr:MAG: hypothetical protein UW18_C0006G0039 [Microgenomates group bacterium GW2011_GWF1_44_10]